MKINLKDIIKVNAFADSSFFIDKYFQFFGCGYNYQSQLGIEKKSIIYTPTKLTFNLFQPIDVFGTGVTSFFVCKDGSIYPYGHPSWPKIEPFPQRIEGIHAKIEKKQDSIFSNLLSTQKNRELTDLHVIFCNFD